MRYNFLAAKGKHGKSNLYISFVMTQQLHSHKHYIYNLYHCENGNKF